MNSVRSLKETPFRKRTQSERTEILNLGRPMPMLTLTQSTFCKGRMFNRRFHASVYQSHDWICGCEVVNAIFCFPCLLFGGEVGWTKKGVQKLNHMASRIKSHQGLAEHLDNEATLCVVRAGNLMGRVQEGENINAYNYKVKQNRYVVSKIIDCLKFCGAFELAMEDGPAWSRGVFNGLLDFTAELDGAVRDHLDKATVFKGTSPTIRNDLLDCLFVVTREKIAEEIKTTEFVAFICDDLSDVSSLAQKALVFRYEFQGKIVERFWGFLNPSENSATSLSDTVLSALHPLFKDSPGKLISQSYDGATNIEEIGLLVRAVYPNAHLVHCYAHDLNAVIKQAVSLRSQPIRTFFHNLSAIPTFFADPSHTALLDDIVGEQRPSPDSTVRVTAKRWNFQTRTVNTVHSNLGQLLRCVDTIENRTLQETTLNQACSLRRQLQDSNFLFWLAVFHHLTPHVDILENASRLNTQSDTRTLDNNVAKFTQSVSHVRSDIDAIVDEAVVVDERRKMQRVENQLELQSATATEVCDVMTAHVRSRFAFRDHVHATRLLLTSNFKEYERAFPQEEFLATVRAYPNLESARLKTELGVIYAREDFQMITPGIDQLLVYMNLNKMGAILKEVDRLARVILTTPGVSPGKDRRLSAPVRLKGFLRRTTAIDRQHVLIVLALDRDLVLETKNLNDMVIDKFAAMKSRRIDLVFR